MTIDGRYHLVGLAGVGMSALAEALHDAGAGVTGSDRYWDEKRELPVLDRLAAQGIVCVAQDGSGIGPHTRAVVVSTAIEDGNPELAAASRHGVPVLHRSAVLSTLTPNGIAVAGTAGKSTVTAMIGWILESAGFDPVVVNGAAVLAWRSACRTGSVRKGKGLAVYEADESDRSLTAYTPDYVVVTNVSTDHFSCAEAMALFDGLCATARKGVVGIVADPRFYDALRLERRRGQYVLDVDGCDVTSPLPGVHNAHNAYCAVRLCQQLGVTPEAAAEALGRFTGLNRRFECAGEGGGVRVYDDYAHNVAKIRASWQTASELGGNVLGIWRPHGYAPLRNMWDAFIEMFSSVLRGGDRLFIMPVYDAGGTADRSVRSCDFVSALRAAGVNAELGSDPVRQLSSSAVSGDIVMVMGARDPDLPKLAREVVRALNDRA